MPVPTRELLERVTAVPSLLWLTSSLVLTGIVFTALETIFAARKIHIPGKTTRLNLVYWYFTPLFTKTITNITLAAVIYLLLSLMGFTISEESMNGFGPLSRQHVWLQAFEMIVIGDFIDYWTHRMLHTTRAWRFHAIHHSSEEMTWMTAERTHPVNDIITRVCQVTPIVLLGFAPKAIAIMVPVLVGYVILLHANIRWTFGPFKYVLVSPAYHRWHHTSDEEGLDKNYAGIFPIWDLMFGTYYFPKREPVKFGVRRGWVPESLLGQLLYPFKFSRQYGTHDLDSNISQCLLELEGPNRVDTS